jgi:hypothetical protein
MMLEKINILKAVKVIYEEGLPNLCGNAQICIYGSHISYMRRPFVIYDFATASSGFPYILGKFCFFLSVQCLKLYVLFPSSRAKLLWWNVPVGGLYGGLYQHSPAFLSVQCTKLYVLFPFSIGQNFSGGMYVWAGSMEDFDNIVRPFYQCNVQTKLYVLFPSSRTKLLWWNVRVGGLYGGL